MSELLEWIERFETARDDLQEVIREAHSTMRAMRALVREIEEAQTVLTQQLAGQLQSEIQGMIDEYVKAADKALKTHINVQARRIEKEFERLEERLFRPGGHTGKDVRVVIDEINRPDANVPKRPKPTRRTTNKKLR